MSVAAVYTCKNEIDIVEMSLRHMLSEGIDHIYTNDGCSDDGTREVIDSLVNETRQITVLTDSDQYVNQPGWMNKLAHMAGADGFEWILPCDIDEFVYSPTGRKVADVLNDLDESINRVQMWVYPHKDINTRFVNPHGMQKIAYRYNTNANIVWGNHAVESVDGAVAHDILAMREMQYRGYEHFVNKAHARIAGLSPSDAAAGIGSHHTRLKDFTDEQMEAEWQSLMSVPMIHDPIPFR